MFTLSIYTPASVSFVHFWLENIPEPQSCAGTLYKQQGAQSDAKEEVWYCVPHCVINTIQTARGASYLPLISYYKMRVHS